MWNAHLYYTTKTVRAQCFNLKKSLSSVQERLTLQRVSIYTQTCRVSGINSHMAKKRLYVAMSYNDQMF